MPDDVLRLPVAADHSRRAAAVRRWLRIDAWSAGAVAAATAVAAPVLAIAWLALHPADDIWSHLSATVLPGYLRTTVLLVAGVGLSALLVGVATAWLVTLCRFPGRRLLQWALLLPLAVPAYVVAYVYTDLLEYAGPVQSLLRELFGWSSRRDYWFPEVRTLSGAVAMLTLALYPYVYLLARAAFLEQSVCALEVSRTLGCGPWASFFRVALPLARPALVIGIALVMMEALNDLGTVQHFAVSTLTVGVYDVWLNMNSTAGAAQLSLVMLAFVLVLLAAERLARRQRRFHHTTGRWRQLPGYRLRGWRALAAAAACALPIALGFGVPAGALVDAALRMQAAPGAAPMLPFLLNSLSVAAGAALLAVAVGLFLAYAGRVAGGPVVHAASRIAGLGYAVPGAVLAVGVVIPLAAFDNGLDRLMREHVGVSTGLLLSGSLAALLFGLTVRFLALSLGACEAGLSKVTPGMDAAARTLGTGRWRMLRRVHLPMLKTSLLTAAILVFVDAMKELPMTLLLRPFNVETLATHVYQYAAHERFEQAAPAALALVAFGMLPVIILSRTIRTGRPGSAP